jgi:biofilm PGA synthesis protein PgaA
LPRRFAALLVAATLLCAARAAAGAPLPDEAFAQAVAAARAGRFDEALPTLAALAAAHPGADRYRYDYAVVLGWAGRHAEALEQGAGIDRARAPAYVLEALGKSARSLGRSAEAAEILATAVRRFPDRIEGHIGLAFALAESGRGEEAERALDAIPAARRESAEVIAARAYLAEQRGDDHAALALYERTLARDPANHAALRGRIFAAARIGAASRAVELAEAVPGLVSPAELAALRADRTAARIRWGAIAAAQGTGPARFAALEAALAESDALAERFSVHAGALDRLERQLLFDRLVGLREAYRMPEAIALYERLVAAGIAVPAYARLAAAGAYLHLERPESARDLYAGVLAAQPDHFAANLGLFYALVETEDHEGAAQHIDRLVAITPRTLHAYSPLTERPNPEYQIARAAQSMAPAYADRLARAEAATAGMVEAAPFSMPLRANAAAVALMRGWPRRADEGLRWVLAAEPDNGIADAERVGPLLAMHEFRAAERAVAHGVAVAAEDKRALLAADRWRVHNLRELYVDAAFGRSSGGAPTGTRDYAIDAWLFSQPLGYDWRAFAHGYFAQARFEDGPFDWQRLGVGVEYRVRDLRLTGEVNGGVGDGGSRVGLAAAGQWWRDDHLSVSAGVQTQSNAIPLQARAAGVSGWSAGGGATYRVSESRSFAGAADVLDFSDGNLRTVLGATWFERLVTGPVFKLDLTAGLYASANTRDDAPYFNPRRDLTPSAVLAADWLTWRRYDRSFRQRLSATLGAYWQDGFGTGAVSGAQYEHVWELDRRLYLRYGIGTLSRPYDGERTRRDYALVTLDWRF